MTTLSPSLGSFPKSSLVRAYGVLRLLLVTILAARHRVISIASAVLIAIGLFTMINARVVSGHGKHAVQYTDTYASSPNTSCWEYFSNADCTNFISQGLYAGGLNMITSGQNQWYMSPTLFGYSNTHSWTVTYDLINHLAATGRGWNVGQEPVDKRYGNVWANRALYGDILFYDLPGVYPPDGPTRRDHAAMEADYHSYHEDDPANTGMHGDVVNYHTKNKKHAIWNLMHSHPFPAVGPNVTAVLYRIQYPSDHQYRTCP